MCKEKIQDLEESIDIAKKLENWADARRYQEQLDKLIEWLRKNHKSYNWAHAFGYDPLYFPGIKCEDTENVEMMRWGMVKSKYKVDNKFVPIKTVEDIPTYFNHMTSKGLGIVPFNARIESLTEEGRVDSDFKTHRCIIFLRGYYEYHTTFKAGKRDPNKKLVDQKIPFCIRRADRSMMMMGAIYRDWADKSTGETFTTFKTITVPANKLMGHVHNITSLGDLRMPLQFETLEDAIAFLKPVNSKTDLEEIINMCLPLPDGNLSYDNSDDGLTLNDGQLEAWTVGKLNSRTGDGLGNTPQATQPFKYPDFELIIS